MSVFETETMAELCVKQGLITEALAIYRRLAGEAPDAATRGRHEARVATLAARAPAKPVVPRAPPPPTQVQPSADLADLGDLGDLGDLEDFDEPTLTLERRGDSLVLAWALPPDTAAPALQLLLVRRGKSGVETETRTLPVAAVRGSTTVTEPALHSVRAAAGRLEGERFVPLARLRR